MVYLPWKTIWQFLKKFDRITVWSSNFTHRNTPKRIVYGYSNKYLYTNVYSSTFHNNQKMEITKMCISGWVDEQNLVDPYNEILLIYNKELRTNTLQRGRISKSLWQLKDVRHKRSHIIWFNLCAISRKVNP